MRWILMVSLLVIVPGCVDPVIPDELKAVLDDPAFSEAAEVVHEGNLDGLPGCWGSYYETDDSTEAYAQFVEFGGTWRYMAYVSHSPAKLVLIREGTYTVQDENTVTIVIDAEWVSDPSTGELSLLPREEPLSWDYQVSLQGDRMILFSPGVEAEQYDGTFWRFSGCP